MIVRLIVMCFVKLIGYVNHLIKDVCIDFGYFIIDFYLSLSVRDTLSSLMIRCAINRFLARIRFLNDIFSF